MAKTQAKQGRVRRVVKRVKRNMQACLGVVCATLLLVAALPMASKAIGEGTQDGPVQANPVVAEAPAAPPSDDALPGDDTVSGDASAVSAGAPLGAPVSDVAPEESVQGDSPMQPSSSQPVEGETSDPQLDEGDESVQDRAPDADVALDESESPATESDGSEAEENGALSATPYAADPPGFSWKFAGIGPDTCAISGYTGGTIMSGTVHVPATNGTGKKVVSIVKGSNNQFENLNCNIDFSAAVNLQRIEQFAFAFSGLKGNVDLSGCANLTDLGQYAFRGSSNLTGVILPPNLTSVGDYAFYQDSALTGSLALPKSLKTLGTDAFSGCKLTSLSIPSDTALTYISLRAFENNSIAGPLTLPANITDVRGSAFHNNKITAVTFQANAIRVGNSAFQSNEIANNPMEGKTFLGLGAYAFADNKLSGTISFANDQTAVPSAGIVAENPDVTKVVLSKNWRIIPSEMFKGFTSLVSVVIPDSSVLYSVGNRAFQNCVSLESIDLNNAPLGDGQNGKAIGESAFQGCTSLKEFHVGAGAFGQQTQVTITISASAFKDCTSLSYIEVPTPAGSSTKASVKIGPEAFMNTNLGAFPVPGSVTQDNPQGTPLGYLPLDWRPLVSIGPRAFKNANLKSVKLPSTLAFVGDGAFANNHMTGLELPRNAALDAQGNVGADVLAGQTVDAPAVWGADPDDPGKADVILEALHALGIVHDRVDSVGLNVPGVGEGIRPDNAGSWKTDHVATYDKALVEEPGATFTYGYEVWRTGGSGPLSHGDVTLSSVDKGVPFTFHYYDDAGFTTETADAHVQWVGVGQAPVEESHGVSSFGLDRPGYRTRPGAYDELTNAGWRTGPGPGGTGSPVDPETVVAVDGQEPEFYNRWIPNSYSVEFDDNWELMVQQSPQLGIPGPAGGPATVPDPDYVSGSTDGLASLAYGEPAALPENGFEMGSYGFAGWATSPDLAEADRVEGSNFFSPGSSIATPDPAPAEGATVTLYAQWKAVDMGADGPALMGFLSIPQSIELQPDGGRLWSKPPGPGAQPGDHAVPVVAAAEVPGATWPDGQVYRVSVTRPGAGAPLLALAADGEADKEIEVLESDGTTVYDPGDPAPGGLPDPLLVIDPKDPGRRAGSFMLRSVDPVGMFDANVRYAGTMTFRVDIVQKGATP